MKKSKKASARVTEPTQAASAAASESKTASRRKAVRSNAAENVAKRPFQKTQATAPGRCRSPLTASQSLSDRATPPRRLAARPSPRRGRGPQPQPCQEKTMSKPTVARRDEYRTTP